MKKKISIFLIVVTLFATLGIKNVISMNLNIENSEEFQKTEFESKLEKYNIVLSALNFMKPPFFSYSFLGIYNSNLFISKE